MPMSFVRSSTLLLIALALGAADNDVTFAPLSAETVEPGQPLAQGLTVENHGAASQAVTVRWSLQVNADQLAPELPDPVLGFDVAKGAVSTVSVDGAAPVDAKLCDGDDYSTFATPWGAGFKEGLATIDLGRSRDLIAVQWLSGDANWIRKVDLAVSNDGKTFTPVAGAQNVELQGKWGSNRFPWPDSALKARWLRLRFHDQGKGIATLRLPAAIKVYEGISQEQVAVPKVGPVVANGTASADIPAHGTGEVHFNDAHPLPPGGYLLTSEIQVGSRREVRAQPVFVYPTDKIDPARTTRFGINCAELAIAPSMARCGFSWVRFENSKWMFFSTAQDKYAFDGSIAPWHVNQDEVFSTYRKLGMQVLPYVFQTPEWAADVPAGVTANRAGYPPRDPADYGEAIYQLVARAGSKQVDAATLKTADHRSGMGLIGAVELWNEPNLVGPSWAPFVGPMTRYFDVMRAGAEGSRRADPTLPVSTGGLGGIDLEMVGELSEHHYADGKTPLDLVDIVNVHFYSGREEPETCGWDPNVHRGDAAPSGTIYPEQIADLVAWRDRLKPGAQLWLTETGNDVGGEIGLSERHQAAKVPRAVMLALAAGIDKVFVYREKGSTPSMHAGAGLLRNDGSVRPLWFTLATMLRQLQGFTGRALRLPTKDPGTWLLLWQDGDRRLLTAWTTGVDASTTLGSEFGPAVATDACGLRSELKTTTNAVISYLPRYFQISDSPALQRLVATAKACDAKAHAARDQLAATRLTLFDFGPSARVGVLRGYGPPRRFTPVGKDLLWDATKDFGFVTPAAGEDDQPWVQDPLNGDSVRCAPETVFRFTLPAGRHRLRISATNMDGKSIAVKLSGAGSPLSLTTGAADGLAEQVITATTAPLELSLADWGRLRWLTATPAP